MDLVCPLTVKTSLPSIAVPPLILEAVSIALPTVPVFRRAIKRSSPIDGSAVMLEARISLKPTDDVRNALCSHVDRWIVILSDVVSKRRMISIKLCCKHVQLTE